MTPLQPAELNALLARTGPGSLVYLVGAGGCGMSALGHLLLDLGHRVVGSDLVVNVEVEQLRARGAEIQIGHAPELLRLSRPVVMVYTSAVRLNNPELLAARELQIPIVRRAVLLAALAARQQAVCVAGMHGKTTTASLLAFALDQLGATPSYAVGALVPQLQPHARCRCAGDESAMFVLEADESDGTLCEFHPAHAILLNVDEEHLDFYANLEAVCREFRAFAHQTRGTLVFCADDARLAALLAQKPGAISYGFNSMAAYRIESYQDGGPHFAGSHFEVWHRGALLGEFAVSLLGEKNASNAAGVIALLHQLGHPPADIARAIMPFKGAARRQEEVFRDTRFRVFDDYGHHPREISVTLRALKALAPRRLLVAFQPHRYTRTQHLLADFATCFGDADKLWVAEIYAASEAAIPGVSGTRLAEAINAAGQRAVFVPTLRELRDAVRAELQPGDLALFLGAGDITVAARELAASLREERPDMSELLHARLASLLSPESVIRRDEPLAKRTTLKVGGRADFYVEPASEDDLAKLVQFCSAQKLPITILGRGSNLLIRDGGVRGVVICLTHPSFERIEAAHDRLSCGAGAKLKDICMEARRRGVGGLEFLEGIPATLGGALRMNAGALGGWVFDVVERVRFMDRDGVVHEKLAGEVQYEYRGCPLFKTHIALGATLKGVPAPVEEIDARLKESNKKRWESQPAQASAGCIFKNPKEIPAGRLIDELGLKGRRVGGALVSDVHANFIVNDGQATARDVLELIEVIKTTAREQRGIELQTEVEIMGENQ
jgi:UDP-N-acetylmuramate--L-alanine ligase/UDP-N-acetylenolpyruvoylglucosamine reductase